MYTEIVFITIRTRNPDIAAIKYSTVRESMAEDKSSTGSTDAVPFPTLTILYIPEEAESIIKEISQKYYNITVEDCKGFFHGGVQRYYRKVTIWSQGIDTLWFNAIVASVKELAKIEFLPIVTGGIMYSI
jgi:hypothetical protein